MQAFESGALDLPHFYFTGDDYRYRFDVDAKTRFLNLLREQFNSGVKYKGNILKWDTVIELKALELSRFLLGRSREMGVMEPHPILDRSDNLNMRRRILSLTQKDAERLGVGKSTLHYLRKHALHDHGFKIYEKLRSRLDVSEVVVD